MSVSFKFVIAAIIGGFIGASSAFYFARTDSALHQEIIGEQVMLKKEIQLLKSEITLKEEPVSPVLIVERK